MTYGIIDVSSSDPYIMICLMIIEIIFYFSMISVPFILIIYHRRIEKKLHEIEKEIHKLNDITFGRNLK